MTKPSVDMIMKRQVSGHSPAHLKWELAKKDAAKKGADLKKLPKEGLGPLLDQFRQYLKGAGEVARYYPTLDDRTLKPLRETKSKIKAAADKYKAVCDAQVQARDTELTNQGKSENERRKDPLRSAWSQLGGSAEVAKAAPDNELVAFNKQQRADKQPEIKLK
jgi:hypothetical protein